MGENPQAQHIRRTFVFLPPMQRLSGGAMVLCRLARCLHESQHPCSLVLWQDAMPDFHDFAGETPLCSWNDLCLEAHDLWIVPEGWPNALTRGLNAGARCVVYVQEWSFLLKSLPEGVCWNQLPVSFLAVSHPVAFFIEQLTGYKAPILPPGIDTQLFRSSRAEADDVQPLAAHESIRIAWMPRKNRNIVHQIQQIMASRLPQRAPHMRLEWVEIDKCSLEQVAQKMISCQIFLASGYPEGFALPPLEAMACGCIPVGFAGMGGWEYMRAFSAEAEPFVPFQPWWPLHEVPWEGNGFYAADADVLAAALNLEHACHLLYAGGSSLARIRAAARQTVAAYTLQKQQEAILQLWE